MQQTALYERHQSAGARIVDFGGWAMPLHYGSQIDEHHAVRRHAGVFDVSHMTVVDVSGADTEVWLRSLLANDISRLPAVKQDDGNRTGKGIYSCMLNEQGGVVDDLIAYNRGPGDFRLVVNAATREADLAWMRRAADGYAAAISERAELSMLAVQGPEARALAAPLLPENVGEAALQLGSFEALQTDGEMFIASTGYTGEDGWEIIAAAEIITGLWDALVAAGVQPCGLGARDTLRLEAGLNLYGQDMTTGTTPLESNLAWTVAWEPAERDFTGRAVLEQQRENGAGHKLVGLVLEGRGIMRAGQAVATPAGAGEITSGGFSPTMEQSIAFARVPAAADDRCEVAIRNKKIPARIVRPPFVRNGQVFVAGSD